MEEIISHRGGNENNERSFQVTHLTRREARGGKGGGERQDKWRQETRGSKIRGDKAGKGRASGRMWMRRL